MPELPEVETTLRGIRPHIEQQKIDAVIVRDARLRWPVPVEKIEELTGCLVLRVCRRAKYLLLEIERATLILHLGMSGSLRVLSGNPEPGKHDHIDIVFNNGKRLRFNDPRRFGCCLLHEGDVEQHELLSQLGPEPLSDSFNAQHLFALSRQRRVSVKSFIMNGHVVVGVGNIYASEALYLAGIHPLCKAGRISLVRYEKLAAAIKSVLSKAIKAGGTTLNDFTQADGKPGYFRQSLVVYGRDGMPCKECGRSIKSKVIAQRNTYYCTHCQHY